MDLTCISCYVYKFQDLQHFTIIGDMLLINIKEPAKLKLNNKNSELEGPERLFNNTVPVFAYR